MHGIDTHFHEIVLTGDSEAVIKYRLLTRERTATAVELLPSDHCYISNRLLKTKHFTV